MHSHPHLLPLANPLSSSTSPLPPLPTAVGYFAFMALESLPGSQFWDRFLLLLTDPACRPALLERGHAPYLGEAWPDGQAQPCLAACLAVAPRLSPAHPACSQRRFPSAPLRTSLCSSSPAYWQFTPSPGPAWSGEFGGLAGCLGPLVGWMECRRLVQRCDANGPGPTALQPPVLPYCLPACPLLTALACHTLPHHAVLLLLQHPVPHSHHAVGPAAPVGHASLLPLPPTPARAGRVGRGGGGATHPRRSIAGGLMGSAAACGLLLA